MARLKHTYTAEELEVAVALCLEENLALAVRSRARSMQVGLEREYGVELFNGLKRPFNFWFEEKDADEAWVADLKKQVAAAKAQTTPPPPTEDDKPVERAAPSGPAPAAPKSPAIETAKPAPPVNGLIAYPGEKRGKWKPDGGPKWEYLRTPRNVDLVWDRLHFGPQPGPNMTAALTALDLAGFRGSKDALAPNALQQDLPKTAPPAFVALVRVLNDDQWAVLAHAVGRATEKGNVTLKDREG